MRAFGAVEICGESEINNLEWRADPPPDFQFSQEESELVSFKLSIEEEAYWRLYEPQKEHYSALIDTIYYEMDYELERHKKEEEQKAELTETESIVKFAKR